MAWGAGFRLYAVALALGLPGRFGARALPGSLQILAHSWVLGVAAS